MFGDAEVQAFFAESYSRLVAAVALIEGSRAGAEDAVQEALARALGHREVIEELPAWVTRVALNVAKGRLRRSKAEARANDRKARIPGRSTDRPDERIDVERALEGLPRRQRQATVLRYYLGMDVTEIAAALGVGEGSVKMTLFRARRSLAASLGEVDEEDDNEPVR